MKRKEVLIVWAVLLLFVCSCCLCEDTRIVETKHGKVQGLIVGPSQQFLGIPFAAPPVNELRWKEPHAPAKWEGVKKTQKYSPACYPVGPLVEPTSEDCLYINVITPKDAKSDSRLPVRVWIYGGSFLTGSATTYTATNLVRDSNTIFVSFNYRLNTFGFLALPELRKESPVLNYGLQDQQFALQWVKDNIHAFGGDANNVMINGESAGGGSVSFHLLMKKSWPLYHKAISESAGFWRYPDLDTALHSGAYIVNQTVCGATLSSTIHAVERGDVDVLRCLRALPASVFHNMDTQLMMLPCVDKQQIMDAPVRLYLKGEFNKHVPLIVGTNYVEGNAMAWGISTMLFNSSFTLNFEQYKKYFELILSPFNTTVMPWYSEFAQKYGYWAAAGQATADYFINCGSSLMADSAAREHNGHVYRYLFAQKTKEGLWAFLNATHGMELPYVFNDPYVFNNASSFLPTEQLLADRIVDYWTSFHHNSKPVARGAPDWPLYGNNKEKTILELNTPISTIENWDAEFCPKWIALLAKA